MGDPTYTVCLVDRLKDLLGEFPEAGPHTRFTYSFDHGYEKYEIQNDGEGKTQYAGSYHPNIVCETGTSDVQGNCIWCGRTLM